MKAVREYCVAKGIQQFSVPKVNTMLVALQNANVAVISGKVADEELEFVPKHVEARNKSGDPQNVTFVRGLHILGGQYHAYTPFDI